MIWEALFQAVIATVMIAAVFVGTTLLMELVHRIAPRKYADIAPIVVTALIVFFAAWGGIYLELVDVKLELVAAQ
ncbi:MAG: hypothetical protein VX529_10425 [Pseudomonadota bacterium]|nr:hypothetical protein [Pseudomonadota bacterium]